MILAAGFSLAMRNQRFQRVFTKDGAHGMQKLHGQIGMGIGKALIAGFRQIPELRRTANALRNGMRRNETFLGQPHQLLAHRLARRAEMFADCGSRLRTAHLERQHDAFCGRTCSRKVRI